MGSREKSHTRVCAREGCGVTFEPVRSDALYHDPKCRQAATRQRRKDSGRRVSNTRADGQLSEPHTAKGRLQRAALKVFNENHRGGPTTSGRFIFYELETEGVVSKGQGQTAGRYVTEALTVLRELGLIPWSAITDETRTLTEWSYADSVAEYMRDRVHEARINPWDSEPPLILTESRSLKGVLESLAYEYVCPIASTNGQCAGFLHTEIGPHLADEPERPVLYLGDLDVQGGQIEANTRAVLEEFVGEELDWTRVAITTAQKDARRLKPIKKTDGRTGETSDAWETEALGQATVVALVREALEDLVPEQLVHVRIREADERQAYLDGDDADDDA